jgi:hypothetical protein
VHEYVNSLAKWESHSLEPFIIFLCQLADKGDLVCKAILGGGVMDYLLHLYALNFSDPLAEKDHGVFYRTSTLYAACNSLILALSGARRGLDLICGHPFHVLWSTRPELPFTSLVQNRAAQRVEVWRSLGSELILRRIYSIFEMMPNWRRPYEQEFLIDIAGDLLEFSG